jgi:ATPase family AAA domain-containing protein 3A/B
MSWLFGYRDNQPPPQAPQIPIASAKGGGVFGSSDDESTTKAMEAYRFDSSALERAAQAAKDLERSSK